MALQAVQHQKGDFVFAHVKGHVTWPSLIREVGASNVLVDFFCPKKTWAWVSKNKVKKFSNELVQRLQRENPRNAELQRGISEMLISIDEIKRKVLALQRLNVSHIDNDNGNNDLRIISKKMPLRPPVLRGDMEVEAIGTAPFNRVLRSRNASGIVLQSAKMQKTHTKPPADSPTEEEAGPSKRVLRSRSIASGIVLQSAEMQKTHTKPPADSPTEEEAVPSKRVLRSRNASGIVLQSAKMQKANAKPSVDPTIENKPAPASKRVLRSRIL